MSTLKVNNLQVGQDSTATNNLTWFQPGSPDGTIRLGSGNAGSATTKFTFDKDGNLTCVGDITANSIIAPIEGTLDDWIVHAGDTNTKFGFPAADTFTVETAGGERFRIDPNGNFTQGVLGNATFSAINSISANAARGIEIFKDGTDTGSAIKLAGDNGSGTKAWSQLGFSGANATAHWASYNTAGQKVGEILIGNSGNIGIGDRTQSPDADLHVHTASGESTIHIEGATNANLNLRSHSGDSTVKFSDGSASNVGNINYDHGTDSLSFRVNASPRLTITSAGQVAIKATGTASTNVNLLVYGDADNSDIATFSGGDWSRGLKISTAASGNNDAKVILDAQNADNGCFSFKTHGDERLSISSTGQLYLGSAQAPKGSAAGSFDLDNGNITMCIGGNSNSTGRTNSTDKINRVTSPHYTNAEEPVAIYSSYNVSNQNIISYGGGSGQTNAVTKHSFYTAANTTTTTGTERLYITSAGNVTVAANSDIRFINGTWSGEVAGKIQHNSNNLYIQGGSGGIRFRHHSNGTNHFSITNGGNFEASTGDIVFGASNKGIHFPNSVSLKQNVSNLYANVASGNNNIEFQSNGTSFVKFRGTNGNVEIVDGDLVISTSGHGIDFSSAADVASGETISSSVLDDYEEGTYAPTISNLGNHTASSNTEGSYTKIGDTVTVRFRYFWTSRSTTNGAYSVTVSLPFTGSSIKHPGGGYLAVEGCQPNASDRTSYHCTVPQSQAYVLFRCSGANVSENSFNGGISTSLSSGYFIGVVSYKTT